MVDDLNVLVVDDESGLADLYTVWLADHHDVQTAYGGQDIVVVGEPYGVQIRQSGFIIGDKNVEIVDH